MSIVTNQILSLEMIVMRLVYLKDMPPQDEVVSLINKNALPNENENMVSKKQIEKKNEKIDIDKNTKEQIKNTIQTKLNVESLDQLEEKNLSKESIASFESLIKLSSKKREIELKYDLERNVNLVKFSNGQIDIGFNENLNKNFVRNLSEKLLEWTGERWIITLTKEIGQKSFLEQLAIKKDKSLEEAKEKESYKKIKDMFPDAELIEIEKKD